MCVRATVAGVNDTTYDASGGAPAALTSMFEPDHVSRLSDRELVDLITVLTAEQGRRALERADVDALVSDGFERGFDPKGAATDPWLVQGILVAPGVKTDRSTTAHSCTFVRVDNAWVWEARERIDDVVRHLPGPRTQMRSITLVAAPEGTSIDRISSKARHGVHELVEVRSYVVQAGELVLVSARAVSPNAHR